MAEKGLTDLPFSEEYDGTGMDNLCRAMAVDKLSGVCAAKGVLVKKELNLSLSFRVK